jgi:hypothetical protein
VSHYQNANWNNLQQPRQVPFGWGRGSPNTSRWGDEDQTSDFGDEIGRQPDHAKETPRNTYDLSLDDVEAAYTVKMQCQNELRKESRQADQVTYRAFRDAHLRGLSAKFPLATTP